MNTDGKPSYCQWCGSERKPLPVTALVDGGGGHLYRLFFCSLERANKATEDVPATITKSGADFDAAREADMSVMPDPFAGDV